MEERNGYRKIIKGTAIFGGVQIFQILISLIRGKMTAILIGAEGVGLSSMYVSSLAMVITFASLGCNLSAVKYISGYDKTADDYLKKVNFAQNLFLILAVFGALLTVLLSAFLSQVSFQSYEQMMSYVILSVYVACSIYSSGCVSILQGMQELRRIAIGNVFPGISGLFFTILLYYYLGIDGVVYALLVLPVCSSVILCKLLQEIYSVNNHSFVLNAFQEMKRLFKEYISLGFITVIAALLGNITAYSINAGISRLGSLRDIGLFQAGMSITNQYVGLVFSAMSMDYLPRLSQVIDSENDTNKMVNSQGEIVTLVALPLLSIMMISAPLLVKVLLSDDFLSVNMFIRIMAFGMLIQAIYFPLAYIPYARGDKKVLFWLEGVWSNIVHFLLLVGGFYYYGLFGTAIANALHNFVALLQTYLLARYRYRVKMSNIYIKLSCISMGALALLLWVSNEGGIVSQIEAVILVLLICLWSLHQLNRRINVFEFFKSKYARVLARRN